VSKRSPDGNLPAERKWTTPSGKAVFSVFSGVHENDLLGTDNVLRLITIRSHDHYNTTIYGLDDRYRGVFLDARGLEHGDLVDIETISPRRTLRLNKITAIEYDIAPGSVAAYYPEANVLVPLDYLDKDSGTPSYKSTPVRILRSGAGANAEAAAEEEVTEAA